MSRKKQMRAVFAIAVSVWLVLIVVAVPTMAGEWGNTQQGTKPRDKGGEQPISGPAFAPHQLVVRLRTDTIHFSADHGAVQGYSAHMNETPVFLVTLDPGVDVAEAASTLSQSPQVEYAHPNYVLNRSHPIQGSYPFSDQNFKGNYESQFAATQLGLPQAHQLAVGSGVVVGVIDGGIDFSHPALGGMAVSGYDFVDNDNDASDEPGGQASGHGTFVAGVIHLVAPSATIRSYRVMNAAGDGDGFTVARAVEQAVADGCSIINISLALTARNLAVRDAIDLASAHGVLVIGGAGNRATGDPVYPAAESNALAVAALDSLSRKAGFSSFGSYVDLCAPGENVYSAYQKPYFAWWSGTSFSAPFVSGMAALVKQKFPSASGLQIRNRLMSTAGNVDAYNPDFIGSLGAGEVEPVAALTSAVTNDTAIFIPYTLDYTYEQFTEPFAVPFVLGVLLSTNAPASFVPRVIDTGTFSFAWVDENGGTTDDSVEIRIRTTNTLGTYYNTVAFDVAGVAEPAIATLKLTVVPRDTLDAAAWLSPPEMWFTGNIHSYSVLEGVSVLSSSNAPAAYYAEIPSGSEGFLMLIDSAGQTDDTVRFGVIPGRVPGPGLYAATIVYHVAGITQPAALIVNLTAVDTGTYHTASVTPSELWYTGSILSDTFFLGSAYLTSTNAPAYYNVVVLPAGGRFATPQISHGQTNDSVGFIVRPNRVSVPGHYTDTIVYLVQGTVQPAVLLVHLNALQSGNAQCDKLGDLNGNNVSYESGDLSRLDSALLTGYISFLGSMIGNADVNADCRIDTVDLAMMRAIMEGEALPLPECGNCASYQFIPRQSPLCNLPGDVNQNGLPWEMADLVALQAALNTGDSTGLAPLIGNSDLNRDCLIDTVDRVLLERVILGYDSAPGTPCGNCQSYHFVPSVKPLCVLPGDVDGNGIRWTVADMVALAKALDSGNIEFLGPSIGNADVDGNCRIDRVDLIDYQKYFQYGLDSSHFILSCAACQSYVFVPETGPDSTAPGQNREVTLTNYPNPFNPITECVYSLPTSSHVTLKVYDVLGREVITLVDETKEAGTHHVTWRGQTSSGNQASSGVYLYRIEANGVSLTRKMLLLK